MTFIGELRERVTRLEAFAELDVACSALPASALALSDESVRDLIAEVGAVARDVGTLQAVLAGVAARRSGRERGPDGLSTATGHRSPVELIQATTGVSRGEATRAVRVGEALLESAATAGDVTAEAGRGGDAEPLPGEAPALRAWHGPLDAALLKGEITAAQHNAILTGLGEPPARAAHEDWSAAAERLVSEAFLWSVEQLTAQTRTVRDLLDPAGAEDRFARRFERRSFRMWADAEGQQRGSIVFDDEMAPWLRGVFDAALRPRRGGPRFMTDAERAAAAALSEDERSNEQLTYDLFVDLVRAGALAEAKDVFGAQEPGVRVVVRATAEPRDSSGRTTAAGVLEDGGTAVPGSVVDRGECVGGRLEVVVDGSGNPLSVGRRERLFSRTQRLALAVRDGGCMWPGCDRPPTYCEAHHSVPWSQGGRTDCDVGILLCRFHHLNLHNGGWSIGGTAATGFVLNGPPGTGRDPVRLVAKSPLRWAWAPPPDRPAWRQARPRVVAAVT